MRILIDDAPLLTPDFFNVYEPVNKPFDLDAPEGALARWGAIWLWRRQRPRVSGRVLSGNHEVKPGTETHGKISVDLSTAAFDLVALKAFFASVDATFGVDFGYIYPWAEPDLSNPDYYKIHGMPFNDGVSTQELRQGLPDLPWGSYFGPPYAKLLGGRLTSAPAYSVEELGEGVFVQLTKDFTDPERDREQFEAVRSNCKRHLGTDAFIGDEGQPAARVPEFIFTSPGST